MPLPALLAALCGWRHRPIEKELNVSQPLLSAHNLCKSFGPTAAVRSVDLSLWGGEILAVMGPSGSGKSTLMLLLAGVLAPDSGEVVFKGQSLSSLPESARSRLRRSDFGLLFQFGQLIPEMSISENVTLPLLLAGVPRTRAAEKAEPLLDRLGILELAGASPTEVSGGQAQRAAMARALITKPRVLFADEPTGALDRAAGSRVLDELTREVSNSGMSVVLITHDAHVAGQAHRIISMEDGDLEPPASSLRVPRGRA